MAHPAAAPPRSIFRPAIQTSPALIAAEVRHDAETREETRALARIVAAQLATIVTPTPSAAAPPAEAASSS